MPGAAVVVIESTVHSQQCTVTKLCLSTIFLIFLSYCSASFAAVLPEDRLDILYHSYDGGGAEISGPSILVRKEVADVVSVYGNYYVDMVTSASIDVLSQGSPYTEERTEYSVGVDYLHDRSMISLGYTNSSESDYDAKTISFGVSQDFFGDLTTISLGTTYGSDIVRRNGSPDFEDEAKHRRYSFGISQIITKSFIVALNFETVVDEGYLHNPYRSVRYVDVTSGSGYSYEPEFYPRTHNSDAFSIKGMYYLPYRAALRAEYRSYGDSWDMEAQMMELRYTHPLTDWGLMLEGKARAYKQTAASFYNDLFPFQNFTGQEFRARDKELSEFSDLTLGIGITYDFKAGTIPFFEKSSLSLYWDNIQFDYDTFLNVLDPNAVTAGSEEPYSFDANVIRFFFSLWY